MHDVGLLRCRKPWYRRAIEMATQWRSVESKASQLSTDEAFLRDGKEYASRGAGNRARLRKSASHRVATSFTRVCLCGPVPSHEDILRPRRSFSYPRSRAFAGVSSQSHRGRVPSARPSVDSRRIFRGNSLKDDVLMRRFLIEEAAMMHIRRRNEIEVIRKRTSVRKRNIGPSPLSRMALADDIYLNSHFPLS